MAAESQRRPSTRSCSTWTARCSIRLTTSSCSLTMRLPNSTCLRAPARSQLLCGQRRGRRSCTRRFLKGRPRTWPTPASPAGRENYGTYPNDLTKPLPGIPALLAELRRRGCKLGVLSNKFDGGVQFIMNKCLPDAVDVQHGEAAAELPRKPDPTGLLTTIEELGSAPAHGVHRRLPGDIHVARNAGCYAVGVDWGLP